MAVFITQPVGVGLGGYRAPIDQDAAVDWNDYGRSIVAGTGAIAGAVAGAVEYATAGRMGGDTRRYFERGAENILQQASPVFQQALGASFLPDEGETSVFKAGIGRSLAAKATNALPSVIAAIIPGGVAGRLALSVGAGRGTAAAVGAGVARGAEATMVAGQVASDVYRAVEAMSDEELENVPRYVGYRAMGMSPEQARTRYMRDVAGVAPIVGLALGAVPGIESRVAGRIAGAPAQGGFVSGALRGSRAEAGQEALQSGGQALTTGSALEQAGIGEVEWRQVLAQAIEGGAVGGLIGGTVGGVANIGGTRRPSRVPKQTAQTQQPQAAPSTVPVKPSTASAPVRAAEAVTRAPPEASTPGGYSASAAAPPPIVPVGTPQSAPKGSSKVYPKRRPRTAPVAVTPTAVTPAPDVAAALAAAAPPTQPSQPVAVAPGTVEAQPVIDRTGVTPPVTPEVTAPPPVASQPEAAPVAPVEGPVQEPVQAVAPAPENVAPQPRGIPLPGPVDIVQPETPAEPRQPRILPDISPRAQQSLTQAADVEKRVAKDVAKAKKAERTPKGRHWTAEDKTKRAADNTIAEEIIAGLSPAPEEANYAEKGAKAIASRAAIMRRARAMVDEAKKRGLKVPSYITSATDEQMSYNDAMLLLSEARRFVAKKQPTPQEVIEFVIREQSIRAGKGEEIRSERRVEGEQAKRGQQKGVETIAAASQAATEEQAAKAEVEREAPPDIEPEKQQGEAQAPAVSKEDVTTQVTKSRKSVKLDTGTEEAEVKGLGKVERAKAASEVKKVEITDELRKKYETPGVTPKVTPKVAEVKARVEAAAKRVDKKATPAQRKAMNYRQGPFNAQGLRMTIQFTKGMERNGKKSPAHYGHILGTEDVDGDPVDVFIGPSPDSDFVLVIDQYNLETGQFDEHKVMFGFKNLVAARDTYLDSFADGRGLERAKDARVMTVEELKKWLNSRGGTKKVAGATHSFAYEEDNSTYAPSAIYNTPTENFAAKDSSESFERALVMQELRENVSSILAKVEASAVQKGSLSEFLSKGKLAAVTAKSSLVKLGYPAIANKINRIAGDVPVYVVTKEDWIQLTGERTASGMYDHLGHFILTRSDVVEQPKKAARVLLHEGVHAAFIRTVYNNMELYNQLEELRAIVFRYFEAEGIDTDEYGLTNIHEFMAEAFSQPWFQATLADIQLPDDYVAKYKLDNRFRSTWDHIVTLVRKALGIPKVHGSALHAVLRISAQLEQGYDETSGELSDALLERSLLERGIFSREPGPRRDTYNYSTVRERLPERLGGVERQEQVGAPSLLRLRTFDQLAQLAKDYFGKVNPVRTISDALEMIRVTAEQNLHAAEPLIDKLYQAERQYKGAQWEEFATLLHDETMSQVYADRDLASQKHLGKDALRGKWAKAQHAELSARYNALPADLKALRRETLDFFRDMQNAMSFGIVYNRILKAIGTGLPDAELEDLAQRLHSNRATDADKELLGDFYDMIMEAKVLSKLEGPYVPLMRRGEWVVKGFYRIVPPANAHRQLDENTWEFRGKDARKQAIAFAEKQDTRPTIRTIWVHEQTEEPWVQDDDGKIVRISKNDFDAEQRFRVTVQNKHVEFFETQIEAQIAAAEYANRPEFASVEGVQQRRFEPGDRQADMLPQQMQRMIQGLENRETYRGMTGQQKNELVQALNEAAIRFMGSTRIQSRRLPRLYVEGASNDLTRNALDYAQSTSGYLARLEHQPRIDAAVKQMHEMVKDTGGNYGKAGTVGRSSIANEVDRRIAKATTFEDWGKWGELTKRVAAVGFLRFLVSPAYSVVNSLQPIMLTYPALAARYGAGRAAQMMFRAYDDIGGLAVARSGIRETARKFRPGTDTISFFQEVRARLKNDNERRMLDYLHARGTIGIDAGLEIARMIEAKGGPLGYIDTGIGYLSAIGRQMPRAVETINRTASALAAYRLEMARSGDHDAAVLYAQEATNLTQGLYSHTDAPPIFNHPLGKLSLQFKKYGQLVYGLLGYQIGKAIRNTNAGDRAEALKALGLTAAAHIIVAGALGLPTEPIKWLVMAANNVLGAGPTWEEVENDARQLAAEWFGRAGGEVLTRGVTRAIPAGLGFDLSTRAGMQDLLTFGEPRSSDPQDIKAYLFDLIGGAPGSMVIDTARGANLFIAGNFVEGAEKLVQLKIASNSIKAYREWSEGKKTAAGYEAQDPSTLVESFIRGFGFTPSRIAETTERRSFFYTAQKGMAAERNDFMHRWAESSPSERMRLWGKIEKWNAGRPKDERLTRSDLTRYMKRRKTEDRKGTVKSGFRLTRRERALFEETERTYNVP